MPIIAVSAFCPVAGPIENWEIAWFLSDMEVIFSWGGHLCISDIFGLGFLFFWGRGGGGWTLH